MVPIFVPHLALRSTFPAQNLQPLAQHQQRVTSINTPTPLRVSLRKASRRHSTSCYRYEQGTNVLMR
jgi:hypothetical protein